MKRSKLALSRPRGIMLVTLLSMMVLAAMMVGIILKRSQQSLSHSSHFRDHTRALEAARSGANRLINLMSQDNNLAAPVSGQVGLASYDITFDPASPWRSVNNLNSPTVSTATNFRGEVLSGNTADIVVTGYCNLAQERIHLIVHKGLTGNRAVAAVGKIVIGGNCTVDGVTSLLNPQPAPGGLVSKYESTAPGDYAITWNRSGSDTFTLGPESMVETVPPKTGGQQFSPSLVSALPADQLQDNAGSGTIPYFDIPAQVSAGSANPAPPGITIGPFGPTLSTNTYVGDDRYVNNNLTVNGDLVLSEGKLFVDGDLTINGGIKGTGAVVVKGNVKMLGGNTVLQTCDPSGVALMAGGDVGMTGVSAAGYLDTLAGSSSLINAAYGGVKAELNNFQSSATTALDFYWVAWKMSRSGSYADYWVNPIPAPDGSHPDGTPNALIPKLALTIQSELGASYAGDARAQKVVHALEEMQMYFRHNADSAPAFVDALGNQVYTLDSVNHIVRVADGYVFPDANAYDILPTGIRRNGVWDDLSLEPANRTLDHMYHDDPTGGLARASRDAFLKAQPLDFSWLSQSSFQGVVYAGGDVTTDSDFRIVGSVICQKDVTLTGGSKLTFNEDYMDLLGQNLPVGIATYEEL